MILSNDHAEYHGTSNSRDDDLASPETGLKQTSRINIPQIKESAADSCG